jgi:hypothetical protein
MDTKRKDKTLDLTIRTPAGHPHRFSFKDNTRVSKVIREVVDHFVEAGQLEDGEYGLALIRDGRSEELASAARLDDYDIVDGDTLALYSRRPQVDGQLAIAA